MSSHRETERKKKTFTGHSFSRRPRRRVLLADTIAERLITLSGIGGIVAVSLVGLFLLWVVLPLLKPTTLENSRDLTAVGDGAADSSGALAHTVGQAMDNYGSLAWHLRSDGDFLVQELEQGRFLDKVSARPGMTPTSWSVDGAEGLAAFGYDDGSIMTVRVEFETSYLEEGEVPASLAALAPGDRSPWDTGLLERTPEGQLRLQGLVLSPDEPIALAEAVREGRLKEGDLVVTVAFGSGFTWGANLIRW